MFAVLATGPCVPSISSLPTLMTSVPVYRSKERSFYRGWSAKPFTEGERRFKQELVPHLAEAWNLCVIRYVDRAASSSGVMARAVTDRAGSIHNAEPGFTDLLRTEVPDWLGPMLPPACVNSDAPAEGEVFRGREILLTNLSAMTDGMRFVGIGRLGVAPT